VKAAPISAVILAGGRAQRMGEVDKGLCLLDDKPLVAWVAGCIAPQVDEVLVSANRNLERYGALGYRVLPDIIPDFPGPLAGLHSGLAAAVNPLWLSVPCDTPFLPVDLVQRLRAALLKEGAELAVAVVAGRMQPVICLGHESLRANLRAFLERGGRRVGEWQAGLRHVAVPFDEAESFRNVNTPEELELAERCLHIRDS